MSEYFNLIFKFVNKLVLRSLHRTRIREDYASGDRHFFRGEVYYSAGVVSVVVSAELSTTSIETLAPSTASSFTVSSGADEQPTSTSAETPIANNFFNFIGKDFKCCFEYIVELVLHQIQDLYSKLCSFCAGQVRPRFESAVNITAQHSVASCVINKWFEPVGC